MNRISITILFVVVAVTFPLSAMAGHKHHHGNHHRYHRSPAPIIVGGIVRTEVEHGDPLAATMGALIGSVVGDSVHH